jgi:tRNA(adenine34) deaminase
MHHRKHLKTQGDSGLCYRNVLGNAQPAWSVDERFIWAALKLAAAGDRREVPVGAVVVLGGVVIGEGFNQPIGTHDPTAHAEIVAIRDAARRTANYRLTGATMYVTIEPCQMCVGAMVHARVARVVYGAREPKAGAIESAMRAHEHPSLNHRLVAVGGVLDEECRSVIQGFFEERRHAE